MADIATEADVLHTDNFTVAVSKISTHLWDEMWIQAPQVLAHDDKALHAARVALRRLRSLLENSAHPQLKESVVPRKIVREMKSWRRELGDIGTAMGNVRDFDVLDEYLQTYAREELKREISPLSSLNTFHKYLHDTREENFAPLQKLVTRADGHKQLRDDFARWAWSLRANRFPEVALQEAAPQILAARVDEAIAMGHVLNSTDEEEQHELRKNLRRLRYTLESFSPAFPFKTKTIVKTLVEMQDVLGEMQDRSVLRDQMLLCFKVQTSAELPKAARDFAHFGANRRDDLLEQMKLVWAQHEASEFWNAMRTSTFLA